MLTHFWSILEPSSPPGGEWSTIYLILQVQIFCFGTICNASFGFLEHIEVLLVVGLGLPLCRERFSNWHLQLVVSFSSSWWYRITSEDDAKKKIALNVDKKDDGFKRILPVRYFFKHPLDNSREVARMKSTSRRRIYNTFLSINWHVQLDWTGHSEWQITTGRTVSADTIINCGQSDSTGHWAANFKLVGQSVVLSINRPPSTYFPCPSSSDSETRFIRESIDHLRTAAIHQESCR